MLCQNKKHPCVNLRENTARERNWKLAGFVLLLALGMVSLAVAAKAGQFQPQSSAARQISKASKMSECRSPLGAPAQPEMLAEGNPLPLHLQLCFTRITPQSDFVPRAPGVFECDPKRPPPARVLPFLFSA
jgi:hypothetical protein